MTPNVLAARYASPEIARIWSPEHKIVLERRLWIAVLKAQRDLGVQTPDGVIEAIEHPDRRFCIGVLWHPDADHDGHGAPVFEGLVSSAR